MFGDPVERRGITVIPVAKARFGFGGGGGAGARGGWGGRRGRGGCGGGLLGFVFFCGGRHSRRVLCGGLLAG